jgi:hypothetical protein
MNYKNMIRNAVPGWNGRLFAHHIGYNGNGHVHRNIPYNANDPAMTVKVLQLLQDAGCDGIIETWQGPWSGSCDVDANLVSSLCTTMGMQFALLLDPGGMQKWTTSSTAVITQNVVSAINAPTTQKMLSASSYVPEKWVLDFNTKADLTSLSTTFPKLKFLPMGKGFSWISIPPITESKARNAASVLNLKSQHSSSLMQVASVCFSFDDSGKPLPVGVQTQNVFDAAGGKRDWTSSVWGGPARILESFAGQFGLQQLATIPSTVPAIAIITATDFDEQSSGPLIKILGEANGTQWS